MSISHTCFGKSIPDLVLFFSSYSLHLQEGSKKNDESDKNFFHNSDTPIERIRALFLSKAHSDLKVSLYDSDGVFEVHKLVLAMTSSVFEKLLVDVVDSITLEEHEDSFKWILLHAYTGYCEPPQKISDVIVLYKTLHKYAMSEMMAKCVLVLRNNINVETVDEIYTLALKYDEKLLIARCIEEMKKSGNKLLVLASNGLLSPELLLDLLEMDELFVREIDIFKAVLSWGKQKFQFMNEDCPDLISFLKPYLHEIDFLSMRSEEILTTVMDENIFDVDEIVGILLTMNSITEEDSSIDSKTSDSLKEDFSSILQTSDSLKSTRNVSPFKITHSLYPTYLKQERKERRFNFPDDTALVCPIFASLKCDRKRKWVANDYNPLLTIQATKTINLTSIKARAECFIGDNYLEIRDHDRILRASSINGPPWNFPAPIEIKRNVTYTIKVIGKGRMCKHDFKLFSTNHYNVEFSGSCIYCDVGIKYIQ